MAEHSGAGVRRRTLVCGKVDECDRDGAEEGRPHAAVDVADAEGDEVTAAEVEPRQGEHRTPHPRRRLPLLQLHIVGPAHLHTSRAVLCCAVLCCDCTCCCGQGSFQRASRRSAARCVLRRAPAAVLLPESQSIHAAHSTYAWCSCRVASAQRDVCMRASLHERRNTGARGVVAAERRCGAARYETRLQQYRDGPGAGWRCMHEDAAVCGRLVCSQEAVSTRTLTPLQRGPWGLV